MPLDPETFSRDLTNCLADAPAYGRHRGRKITLHVSTADDIFRAIENGIEDDMAITVIANANDFGNILPRSMDDFEILVNKKWVKFQIRNAPDYYHAGISPIYQLHLQSPHKGIV